MSGATTLNVTQEVTTMVVSTCQSLYIWLHWPHTSLCVSTARTRVRIWWARVKSLSAVLWAAMPKVPSSLLTSVAKINANTSMPEASAARASPFPPPRVLLPSFNLLFNKLWCWWRIAQLAAERLDILQVDLIDLVCRCVGACWDVTFQDASFFFFFSL